MAMCAQLAAIGIDIAGLVAEEARAEFRAQKAAAQNATPQPATDPAPDRTPGAQHPSAPEPNRIATLKPKFETLVATLDAEAEPAAGAEPSAPRLAESRRVRTAVRLYQYALRAPRLKPISAAALFHRLATCVRAFIAMEIGLATGNLKKIGIAARTRIKTATQTATAACRAASESIPATPRCVLPLKSFAAPTKNNPSRTRLLQQTRLSTLPTGSAAAPQIQTATKIIHYLAENIAPTLDLAGLAKKFTSLHAATVKPAAKPYATAPP